MTGYQKKFDPFWSSRFRLLVIMMGRLVISLFFARFWVKNQNRLFAIFSAAFLLC